MEIAHSQLYKVPVVARRLDVSVYTLKSWVKTGKIGHIALNRSVHREYNVRISEEQVQAFLAEQAEASA